MQSIYLDNNATTCLDSRVAESFCAALKIWGNPASMHSYGRAARHALLEAKEKISQLLGVAAEELLFTSSATEAINTVLRGLFYQTSAAEIITTTTEHAAVYETIHDLADKGHCKAIVLPVESHNGTLDPQAVAAAITPQTRLVAVMAANNETGVKHDVLAIAAIAERYGVPLLVDAVAAFGKEPLPQPLPRAIAALCLSGHKIHGLKGAAVAVVRKTLCLQPLITGGGQQAARRAGTEDVAAVVALAKAIELALEALPTGQEQMRAMRDYFEEQIVRRLPYVQINGGNGPRLVNTSNLAFHGIDGESLLIALDAHGVMASLGSACSSGAIEPSRTLLAMGLPMAVARSSLRFSLSRMTTMAEIESAIAIICRCCSLQRL